MIVPAIFVKDQANKKFTESCLRDPDKFKVFYNGDSLNFTPYDTSHDSTWYGYDFISMVNDNVVGRLYFNCGRPTRIIDSVTIALYDEKYRMTFYKDLKTVLKMVHEANHPVLYFKTIAPTDAYDLYEKLCGQGYLEKCYKPHNFTIIRGKEYDWHEYAMTKENLGRFLEK